MSPGSSEFDQDQNARADDANSDASKKLSTSGGDIEQEGRSETPHPEREALRSGIRDDGFGHVMIEGALMGEVRNSLHTISNGVEELSATVQDLLGLSGSDSSEDYNHKIDGGRQFSWSKLKSHAISRRRRRKYLKHAQGGSQQTSSNDDSESDDEGRKPPKEIIPEVKECNFAQFITRRPRDGRKTYCVDVLVAGDSLDVEISDFDQMIESGKPVHISDLTESSIDEEKKWIRRIRINSRAVMEMLQHVCPELKVRRGQPTIFHRPFQLLVRLHKQVKEKLAHIKELATESSESGTDVANSKSHFDLPKSKNPDWDTYVKKLGDNHYLLEQLTCFVDFMETRIMPDSRRYSEPPSSRPKTIRCEDLWYLLKPGDLVYINHDPGGPERLMSKASAQKIIRVIQTSLTSTSPLKGPLGLPHVESRWFILGHFIDYDGDSYIPVAYLSRQIVSFTGELKVTELPVYPISYLEDDQVMAQAMQDGATYVSLIERRSGFYSGWTQTANPFGHRLLQESLKNALVSPEHIESDILVDFQETFNAFPDWRPVAYATSGDDVEGMEPDVFHFMQSLLPHLEWDKDGKTRNQYFDQVLASDQTELIEAKRFLTQDALGQFRKHTRTTPTGEYLALLPRRFFAYAVLERKFVQLNTRFVRSADVEANDKAFKKLEIDRNYKRLILSLVKSHFDKIETEKKTNVEIETQDLIRGKGKGIVILLHGVPGVGKTATAEAVALKWKKPLFPITCGDLGYTAETLEKSLHEIFRLAHHWGCILLLDEADVFITQRERHDLKRNALVSAFLRVLEYYNGIMFLTTNRAGVLDEAIKSRVHLNLYYDHLTEEQTVAIFKQHIQRLREIEKQRNPDPSEQIWVDHKEIIQFARDHFNQRDNTQGSGSNFGRWNGRQIRNAFLIASSLAHYDSDDDGEDEDKDELAEPSRKKQKQLGRSQFEVVAKTTLMYDQYRATVHSGKSDDHVAFEREERAMSSQPRSPTPVRMKNMGRSLN